MTEKKKAPTLKGKRTYAAVTALGTVAVAAILRKHLPQEVADLLANEVVAAAASALTMAALYFRAKATAQAEAQHTDTQSTKSAGPKFN